MRILRQGQRFLTVELGETTVTMLSDGETVMPPDRLRGPDGAQLADLEPVRQKWNPVLSKDRRPPRP
jgi:hypothetical protein